MDEPSEQISAADSPDVGCPARSALWIDRRGQGKAPVGPLQVVVLHVHAEHTLEVPTAEDEHPVQALGPDRADPTLGEGEAFGDRMGVQMTSVPSERRFGPWLDEEFSLSRRSAEQFMAAARRFGSKNEVVSHLPAGAVFELSAPSVPDELVELVIRARRRESLRSPLVGIALAFLVPFAAAIVTVA